MKEKTPFHLACSHGSVEVVKLMINSPKVNVSNNKLNAALDEVIEKIRFEDPRKREVYQELKTLLEEYSKRKANFKRRPQTKAF